ncbi:cation-transporting ATPase [Nocardioides sp. Root122]|uniref:heavy-metal-associated domain-containing protein n=1 Tax=Nocardioides TaxID=1839 RepID=UPI0007039AC3|nr:MULTISPECIES: heavy metal-associated domain-containing protein [Nocardioides]KQV69608.1 cation-transporting ATPase [Nocardioides sp. Root122]MCK9824463.1 heavy-metal-associated domain-containing protein [Nocardioides cavernae]
MSTTETYDVVGMTCDHCVRSVTEEVSALQGVSAVDVDLASGKVHVTTREPVTTEQVREAVAEAGYQLV